jgi:hypothetical protein
MCINKLLLEMVFKQKAVYVHVWELYCKTVPSNPFNFLVLEIFSVAWGFNPLKPGPF